jgi:long-chain acyl-CoA synthetase
MNHSDPLVSAWEDTLRQRARHTAIVDERGTAVRTFEEISARAEQLRKRLSRFGPNAVIGVQIGNHPDWPSVLLACRRERLVVVPLDQSITAQERGTALKFCCAAGLIEAGGLTAPGGESPDIRISSLNGKTPEWTGNPPALLKLTSGTTGAPRAVRFRSEQLIADCVQICDTMDITGNDLNFAAVPISHSYGFSNLLTPLLVRGVPLALTNDRLPRAVFENLNTSGATVFAGMPVFYQSLVAMYDRASLPRLRLCISAGAPLPPGLASRFNQRFGLTIHSFYGASECGGICYDRQATVVEDGFVGQPMNGVRVEMIEPGGASQIRVHSPAVGDGYFPEANDNKLRPGVFTPDDLLVRSDLGYRVVGRVSDLINVAGKKVNPADIEAELLGIAGVREAVVFGRTSALRNQEVAACVVASADVSELDLLKACRRKLSGWQVPKRIFMLDALPVNERGKVSRRELSAKFAND